MKVTADGAWGLTQAAWPHFKAQKFGRIVLIQSAAGFYGRVGMPAYGIAKSSMIGFTSYLAQEGAPHGILVNNVSPVGWSRASASEGERLSYMEQMTPASSLAPVVSTLLHPDFDRTNLMLHSGGGVITRMFVPETKGVALKPSELTPATIFARFDEIIDETDYRPRTKVDEVGKALMDAIRNRDA